MPFIETPSGIRIHYDATGEGRSVVFLHGWAMSGRVWRYQAEEFSSGYRVIIPDLRGHGESSAPTEGYRFEDFAADIAELFERLNLRHAVLVGWSMGAQVAMRTFPLVRERLAALVFVGGTPKFTASDDFAWGLPAAESRGMAIRLRRNYTKTMGEFFHGMFAGGELSPEDYRRIARDIVTGGKLPEPRVALKALDSLASADLRPLLAEIGLPVFLLHGSEDTVTLPEASRYMAERLEGATLAIMEGCGHAPFLSRPEAFAALLHSFLEKIHGEN